MAGENVKKLITYVIRHFTSVYNPLAPTLVCDGAFYILFLFITLKNAQIFL